MWMATTDDRGVVKYWQSNMNNVHSFQAHNETIRGCRWELMPPATGPGTLSSSVSRYTLHMTLLFQCICYILFVSVFVPVFLRGLCESNYAVLVGIKNIDTLGEQHIMKLSTVDLLGGNTSLEGKHFLYVTQERHSSLLR